MLPIGGETGLTGTHTVRSRTLRVKTSFFYRAARQRRCDICTRCSVCGLNFDALLIFTRHEAAARQNRMILDTEQFCCCCCFIVAVVVLFLVVFVVYT